MSLAPPLSEADHFGRCRIGVFGSGTFRFREGSQSGPELCRSRFTATAPKSPARLHRTGDAAALLAGLAGTTYDLDGRQKEYRSKLTQSCQKLGIDLHEEEKPMENWAMHPEVLKTYARHWKTGEVIPQALVAKIKKAELFNQGFKTVEYVAASLLDMEWHTLSPTGAPDTESLERIALARMGMPRQIVPRYRSTYFQHIFSGGYSAGYYSYIWAEVLDADAFRSFEEKGIFDPATALSFRRNILEKGNSEEPMVLYERFRGRAPEIGPLLKKRGLAGGPVAAAVPWEDAHEIQTGQGVKYLQQSGRIGTFNSGTCFYHLLLLRRHVIAWDLSRVLFDQSTHP